jgi:hypothetical protein
VSGAAVGTAVGAVAGAAIGAAAGHEPVFATHRPGLSGFGTSSC